MGHLYATLSGGMLVAAGLSLELDRNVVAQTALMVGGTLMWPDYSSIGFLGRVGVPQGGSGPDH